MSTPPLPPPQPYLSWLVGTEASLSIYSKAGRVTKESMVYRDEDEDEDAKECEK
jgi:hypothetical protein